MTWEPTPIESWRTFTQQVVDPAMAVTPPLRRGYVFRGQADANWNLEPSFARHCIRQDFSAEKALEIEGLMLNRFQEQAHLHVASHLIPTTILDWWTLMQHHGAPTRILDWTHSPLVALYFAVVEHWDLDGAVWSFHRRTLMDRSETRYGEIPNLFSLDEWLRDPNADPRVMSFDRARLTDRMVAQQGAFTISKQVVADHAAGIEAVLPADEQKSPGVVSIMRAKYVIPANIKRQLLRRLHGMNVTAGALFPGVDGLGRAMEELMKLGE